MASAVTYLTLLKSMTCTVLYESKLAVGAVQQAL